MKMAWNLISQNTSLTQPNENGMEPDQPDTSVTQPNENGMEPD